MGGSSRAAGRVQRTLSGRRSGVFGISRIVAIFFWDVGSKRLLDFFRDAGSQRLLNSVCDTDALR